MKAFINIVTAFGGGDGPEDVTGGLDECLKLSWAANSTKQVFHIFDAPCHGKEYHSMHDNYPGGCPKGLKIENLIKQFEKRNIAFNCIKVNNTADLMIKAMQNNHSGVTVSDLTDAVKNKTKEEVDKMFVDTTSFILRTTLGGKSSAKKKSEKKPMWDPKQLAINQHFSSISYLKVNKIEGNQVTVENHDGGAWLVSSDILQKDMWSADHFEREVKCSMTDLAQIIESCGDTVFKVCFAKQIDDKIVD